MISGPVAAVLLADQGADVIKVEPPQGELVRYMGMQHRPMSGAFMAANRGKRSLVLDLSTERGRELLLQLAATVDVLLQNFRPGTIERMGLGEDVVRAVRPDIIYVSISGFGEQGPYAAKRVYDPVIQALSGLATIQADRGTGRPHIVRTIIPDKVTALTAAQAISAALFARERSGAGQHIRVSMLDASVSFLWPEGLVTLTWPGDEQLGERTGLSQDLIYQTSDGYITVGAVSDDEWRGLCEVLERPEWLTDERFNTPSARVINAPERLAGTQEVLIANTSAYWLQCLDAQDVPCAPVLKRHEMLEHPQLRASGIITEVDDPEFGVYRQARSAARFSGTPVGPPRRAPQLGEHGREVLDELGLSDRALAALYNQGIIRAAPP